MKKMSIVFVAVLLLSGCCLFSVKEDQEPVVKTEYVVIDVPKSLFTECRPEKPFTVDNYLTLSQIEREQYLTDYVVGLMGTLKDCNGKLTTIKTITEEKKKLMKSAPE